MPYPFLLNSPARQALSCGWRFLTAPTKTPSPCTISPEPWRAPCSDWSLIFPHSPDGFLNLATLWIGIFHSLQIATFKCPSSFLLAHWLTPKISKILLICTKQKYNINSYLEVIDLGIVDTVYPLASIPLWFHSFWAFCENSHLPILFLQSLAVEDNPTAFTLLSITRKVHPQLFLKLPKHLLQPCVQCL